MWNVLFHNVAFILPVTIAPQVFHNNIIVERSQRRLLSCNGCHGPRLSVCSQPLASGIRYSRISMYVFRFTISGGQWSTGKLGSGRRSPVSWAIYYEAIFSNRFACCCARPEFWSMLSLLMPNLGQQTFHLHDIVNGHEHQQCQYALRIMRPSL